MKKKSTLPTSYVHAQVAGDGFLMTASYDNSGGGGHVKLSMVGSPAAVAGHLLKTFKNSAPLFGALASVMPKTDREIAQETITEQNQRRNPSLRPKPKKRRAFVRYDQEPEPPYEPTKKPAAEIAAERRTWATINRITENTRKNLHGNSAKTPGKPRSAVRRRRKG